jgi:hypothetical protein
MFDTISAMTQLSSPYCASTSKTVAGPGRWSASQPGDASDRTTPRFARHEIHVRAVLAAGGFPVMGRRP